MKVVITGGCGFIGSHAVEYFIQKGCKVIIVDALTYCGNKGFLPPCPIYKLNISDKIGFDNLIKGEKPDLVLNFAAETHVDNSIKDAHPFIVSNILGAASVAESCIKNQIPLIHISTDEVYGACHDGFFDESTPLNPQNPYSSTKASADLLIQAFNNTYGLKYLIIRPSNNYGPRQFPEKFIPKLLEKIRTKQFFPLYGNGKQIREWTYVKDTARIIFELIEDQNTQWNTVYNLSSGISLENTQVIQEVILAWSDIKSEVVNYESVVSSVADRPGHDIRYALNTKKLDALLSPHYTPFKQGISEIIQRI